MLRPAACLVVCLGIARIGAHGVGDRRAQRMRRRGVGGRRVRSRVRGVLIRKAEELGTHARKAAR